MSCLLGIWNLNLNALEWPIIFSNSKGRQVADVLSQATDQKPHYGPRRNSFFLLWPSFSLWSVMLERHRQERMISSTIPLQTSINSENVLLKRETSRISICSSTFQSAQAHFKSARADFHLFFSQYIMNESTIFFFSVYNGRICFLWMCFFPTTTPPIVFFVCFHSFQILKID